jgi:hypothetical protein
MFSSASHQFNGQNGMFAGANRQWNNGQHGIFSGNNRQFNGQNSMLSGINRQWNGQGYRSAQASAGHWNGGLTNGNVPASGQTDQIYCRQLPMQNQMALISARSRHSKSTNQLK